MRRTGGGTLLAVWLLAVTSPAGAGAEEILEFDCLLEPVHRIQLATAAEGVIERVLVDRGDRVQKGQVLVELESDVERAAAKAAQIRAEETALRRQNEIRLTYAKQVLSRRERLEVSQIISESQLEEAASTRDLAQAGILEAEEQKRLAEAQLEQARALLELRRLQSPVDGIVVKRMREPGELATEQPILELATVDPLHVEVLVPSEHLGRVTVGMRAVVTPEAPIGGQHEARVIVVDPIVNAASGTFGARAELANPDGRIPAGLECRVEFLESPPIAATAEEEPTP